MSISILTQSCKYFAAPYLAESLNANLYVIDHSQDEFFGEHKISSISRGIRSDHLIVVGTRALLYASEKLDIKKFKTVAVIFSDTNCSRLENKWKPIVDKYGIFTYATPDLIQYCYDTTIPVYHTITIPNFKTDKTADRIVISHSPGSKVEWKGTDLIISAIEKIKNKHEITFNLLTDKSWNECLKIKAQSHIFIDQIVLGDKNFDQSRFRNNKKYLGSIGKSGLEGMLLGCCTISGCQKHNTDSYFPTPPVVYTDCKKIKKDLESLIENPDRIEIAANEQKNWAQKYLSPEFVSKHLTQHIYGAQIIDDSNESVEYEKDTSLEEFDNLLGIVNTGGGDNE